MYKIFISLRYLVRNWLNVVGMLAVALAVAVPITVLSVLKGFDEQLRERTRATLSDIIIRPFSNEPFTGYEELVEKIEKLPHVRAAAGQFSGLGLIRIAGQDRYVNFIGIDLARELASSDLASYYRAARAEVAKDQLRDVMSSNNAPAVLPAEFTQSIVSRLRQEDFELLSDDEREALEESARIHDVDIAAGFGEAEVAMPEWYEVDNPEVEAPVFLGGQLAGLGRTASGYVERAAKGSECVLIMLTEIHGSARAFQRCIVSGSITSGISDYDQRVLIVPIEALQKRLHKEKHATQINIRLDDFAHAPEVRAMLWGLCTSAELKETFELLEPLLVSEAPQGYSQVQANLEFILEHAQSARSDDILARTVAVERALFIMARNTLGRVRAGEAVLPEEDVGRIEAFWNLCIAREKDAVAPTLMLSAKAGSRELSFRVSTWQDERHSFLRAIKVEQRLMAFILFFVALVAGFLIFAILHTTVHTKTKDIGILKSIGARVPGIMSLFLLNGMLIAVVGAVAGCIGGLLITKYVNELEMLLSRVAGFKLFPRDIYFFDRMPVDKDPVPEAIVIAITAIVISLAASMVPAWKAARMDPVEALRYE